jgi:hypothetical protein
MAVALRRFASVLENPPTLMGNIMAMMHKTINSSINVKPHFGRADWIGNADAVMSPLPSKNCGFSVQ